MEWCTNTLISGGYNLPVLFGDKEANGGKLHTAMYCFLRSHVQDHVGRGNQNPRLSLLPPPKENKRVNIPGLENTEEVNIGGEDIELSDSSSSVYDTDSE